MKSLNCFIGRARWKHGATNNASSSRFAPTSEHKPARQHGLRVREFKTGQVALVDIFSRCAHLIEKDRLPAPRSPTSIILLASRPRQSHSSRTSISLRMAPRPANSAGRLPARLTFQANSLIGQGSGRTTSFDLLSRTHL